MRVVVTAGHVDHGKSTLVRALTGVDPDRLAEEKRRGLTIDLGFASAMLPSGRRVAFVDVPGHVRFLKNMLAGLSGIDACLFVVAATEGWKPQSEEHLRILDLLDLRHGLVAVTKAGEADDELLDLAQLDVTEHTAGTFLDGAPTVAVDSLTGLGLDCLTSALDRVLENTPAALDRDRPRMWIDRAFAVKGSGTVVTGTLTGGSLSVGDSLEVLPTGKHVRVRAMQSLHQALDEVSPGNRAALNLSGISQRGVSRGDAIVRSGQWHATDMVDAELSVLGSVEHSITRRGAYVAYFGSGEHSVKLQVLGFSDGLSGAGNGVPETRGMPPETGSRLSGTGDGAPSRQRGCNEKKLRSIAPGTTGLVRLHLRRRLPLVVGDRFVLRESGRSETVGGGEVLDVDPVLPAARARPDRSVDRMIAERGLIEVDKLIILTGVHREPDAGRWAVAPDYLKQTRQLLNDAVIEAGPLGLSLAELSEFERVVIAGIDGLVVETGRVLAAGARDMLSEHPFLKAAAAAPFTPPTPTGVDRDEIRLLVQQGLIEESCGVYFAAEAVREAALIVARLLVDQPEGVTVADVRDALGTTRKYALALLACLDENGVTRRRGDHRIRGPRLPTP